MVVLGLRGIYHSYEGPRLAMAALGKLVSAAGQGFSSWQGSEFTSPFGNGSSRTGSQAIYSGIGAGVGGAGDEFSQYFMDELKMMSPILIVPQGTIVTVRLTQGVVMKWQDRADKYIEDPAYADKTANAKYTAWQKNQNKTANQPSDNVNYGPTVDSSAAAPYSPSAAPTVPYAGNGYTQEQKNFMGESSSYKQAN